MTRRALVLTLAILISGCNSSSSSGGGKQGALSPPASVSATAGVDDVTITFSPVPGADSYNIYWAINPAVTKATGMQIASAVSPEIHSNRPPGTSHYYVVTSVRNSVEGAESIEVFATPTGVPAPAGLSATGGDQQVTLDWQLEPTATSYVIYWSTSPGVTRVNGTPIPVAAPPYDHLGLTNGVLYYYVVTSVQGIQEGLESNEVFALAAPPLMGILDTTFNGFGWVTHDNAAGGGGADHGWAVTTDSVGRILVSGSSISSTVDFDMIVWRYNSDGTLDTTFNGRGWVNHHGAAGGGGWEDGWGITVDSSGRILVGGDSENLIDYDMVIWRLNQDGTLDTTFNSQGWVTHHNAAGGGGDDFGYSILEDGIGRILVAGSSLGPNGDYDMVVWRWDSTGVIDPSWGFGGVAVHDSAAGGGFDDEGFDVMLDSSNRVLVNGYSFGPTSGPDMVIWRYDDTGALDTSFGTVGFVFHHSAAGGSGEDYGDALVEGPGGRLILAGTSHAFPGDWDIAILVYNPDGTLDPSFGSGGIVTHNGAAGGGVTDDIVGGIALFSNSQIIVTGRSENVLGDNDMVTWAYDMNGQLDPTFGVGGLLVHDSAAGGSGWDQGSDVIVDGSGRILVAGSSVSTTSQDMALWRIR
ncbi:MAG: hypothetical protein O7H41_05375 [Planctomycetota bacterium]|nr:hypothetical protein [Planctomycetota bacterium]